MQLFLDFSPASPPEARAPLPSRFALQEAGGRFDPANEPEPADRVASLKARIARLERVNPLADWGVAPFGDRRVDFCFPNGGLPRGCWHEIAGDGLESEAPAAGAAFAARLARQSSAEGAIFWILQRDDAHAPGLQGCGLDPCRVIFVRAANDAGVLAVCEDALRTRGVAGVIGETAALSLTAGKRLQLACEHGGAGAFMLRRRLYGAPRKVSPQTFSTAAATRWRIAPAASENHGYGLGEARWRVLLERCRGGRRGAWIMEARNETDDATAAKARAFRVVAELADHAAETRDGPGLAAGRGRAGAGVERERRQAVGGDR